MQELRDLAACSAADGLILLNSRHANMLRKLCERLGRTVEVTDMGGGSINVNTKQFREIVAASAGLDIDLEEPNPQGRLTTSAAFVPATTTLSPDSIVLGVPTTMPPREDAPDVEEVEPEHRTSRRHR